MPLSLITLDTERNLFERIVAVFLDPHMTFTPQAGRLGIDKKLNFQLNLLSAYQYPSSNF